MPSPGSASRGCCGDAGMSGAARRPPPRPRRLPGLGRAAVRPRHVLAGARRRPRCRRGCPTRPPGRGVTAVVPARDEAATIGATVASLLAQDYPGEFRLIVVDDRSSDGTGDLARAAARRRQRGSVVMHRRARARRAGPASSGRWSRGCGRPCRSEPDCLLFTDADIRHAPDSLRMLVRRAYAVQSPPVGGDGRRAAGGADLRGSARESGREAVGAAGERESACQTPAGRHVLVSLMARLRCESPAERWLIPAFIFFFQMLYPFRWSNDPAARTAAAAGGCVLLDRAAFERAGGLAPIRGALIDDCALARRMKAVGPIWTGLTDRVDSLRPYDEVGPIRRMVARTAYAQLGYRLAGAGRDDRRPGAGFPGAAAAGLCSPSGPAALAGAGGLGRPWLWLSRRRCGDSAFRRCAASPCPASPRPTWRSRWTRPWPNGAAAAACGRGRPGPIRTRNRRRFVVRTEPHCRIKVAPHCSAWPSQARKCRKPTYAIWNGAMPRRAVRGSDPATGRAGEERVRLVDHAGPSRGGGAAGPGSGRGRPSPRPRSRCWMPPSAGPPATCCGASRPTAIGSSSWRPTPPSRPNTSCCAASSAGRTRRGRRGSAATSAASRRRRRRAAPAAGRCSMAGRSISRAR